MTEGHGYMIRLDPERGVCSWRGHSLGALDVGGGVFLMSQVEFKKWQCRTPLSLRNPYVPCLKVHTKRKNMNLNLDLKSPNIM